MSGLATEVGFKIICEFDELDGQIVDTRLRDTLKFEISTLND